MTPFTVTKRDNVYQQLRAEFQSRRNYGSVEKLPGEMQLARRFAVGRVTVRAALERLEAEGVIMRVRGKGTFLSPVENSGNRVLIAYLESLDISSSSNYILPGIQRRCGEYDLQPEMMPLTVIRFAGVERALDMLRSRQYRGVLLLGHCYRGDEDELEVFRRLNLPVVLPHGVAQDAEVTGFATLYYLRREGMTDAVRYLVSQGRKRFATFYDGRGISLDPLGFGSCDSYLEMLDACGADADGNLLIPVGSYGVDQARDAMDQMLALPDAPDTILCHSDFCALNVYKVAAERGIEIPSQLGVMGFCGFPGGNLLAPPLATIDLMYENIGSCAVDLLLNSAEWFGRTVPCQSTSYQLIKGESI